MTFLAGAPGKPLEAIVVERAGAKAGEGAAIDVDVGEFVVRSDMPLVLGGSGLGPRPEQLMLAAVAACLLMEYRRWATELGVAIQHWELALATETDVRGRHGGTNLRAGWLRLRWHVRIATRASEAAVLRVLESAEQTSACLDTLDARCNRLRTYELVAPDTERTRSASHRSTT